MFGRKGESEGEVHKWTVSQRSMKCIYLSVQKKGGGAKGIYDHFI